VARPGEPLIPIKVAWCAISGGFLHLFAARDAGLFAKYGLELNATLVRGSDPTLAAVQSGELDFAYCAADATIPGMAAGIDAVLIGAPLVGLPYVLVAHPDIQSLQDLRGKTVGINRPGDLDERLNRAMLASAGMQADDVALRPTGGQTERYQALLAGQIDAVTVTPPLDVQARKDGLHVVFDLGQLPIPFTYSALHTNSKMIRERPDVVRRFVAAMAESVQYVETHKAESERALSRELQLEDPESLDSAYTAYAERFVNRGMDVPLRAVQDSIDYARQQGTRIQRARAEDIVDSRFTTELRDSGFLQALWGRPIPAPTPQP
jgi:NitT/TauT family transport system substrate-binding protein